MENIYLCRGANSGEISHILYTKPVTLYRLPDFEIEMGEENPKLQSRVEHWYRAQLINVELRAQRPSLSYKEAMEVLRNNVHLLNLDGLAKVIGISNNLLTAAVCGVKNKNGAPIVISRGKRDIFIDVITYFVRGIE